MNQPSAPRDLSDDFFQIVPLGHDYYVSPTGDDGNSGRSIDQPMASVPALIQAYGSVFQPGDVVHFAAGTYTLSSNIVLGSQENGLTFQGPLKRRSGDPESRANTDTTSYVFQLNGATGVTLDHLSITGAYYRRECGQWREQHGVDSVQLRYQRLLRRRDDRPTNSNGQFLNNNIHDNYSGNSGNVGLSITAEGAIISGNFFFE